MAIRRTLVLTGGGVLGVTYSGAFRAIEEKGISLQDFDSVYGTSVGGLVGLLVVLGLSHSDIQKLLMSIPIASFFQINANGILSSLDTGGIDTGCNLRRLIQSVLFRVTGRQSFTFSELYARHNTFFTVNAFDIQSGNQVLLNTTTSPHVSIEDALCATCAIPGLYVPVRIQNKLLVDGGVCNALLIQSVPEKDLPGTLALAPVSQPEIHDHPQPDLLYILRASFISLITRGINMCSEDPRYKDHIVKINTPISSSIMLSAEADDGGIRNTLDFIGYTEVSRSAVVSKFIARDEKPSPKTDTVQQDSVDLPPLEENMSMNYSNVIRELSDTTEQMPNDISGAPVRSLSPPIDTRKLGGPPVVSVAYQPTV